MKVSILIPVYKAEKYIAECLRSLFMQTYENIEYVFVNDASPDSSIDIVRRVAKEYPQRLPNVIIVENECNRGVAYTRNVLMEKATGDYIYFVDSDDFIELDTIETFVATAQKENTDIVRCDYFKYVDGLATPIIRQPIKEGENLMTHCLSNNYGMESLCFLFIRRSIITQHQLRFPEGINGCEDFLMTVHLFYHTNKVVDLFRPLYYYRMDNAQSITHQPQTFRTHSIQAVQEIITFLKGESVYEQYLPQLLQLMFTSKQHFLINKNIRDINKYINTFPESSGCYKAYPYNNRQKLLFFLAEHHMTSLLKLICKLT